jgi:hypothetical protein
VDSKLCLPFAFTLVSCSAYSSTLKMEAKPKRPLTFNGLYGVISQMTELFTTIAVSTSNSTKYFLSRITGFSDFVHRPVF